MTDEESDFIKLVKANPTKAQDHLDNMFMESMIGKMPQSKVNKFKNLFKEYN